MDLNLEYANSPLGRGDTYESWLEREVVRLRAKEQAPTPNAQSAVAEDHVECKVSDVIYHIKSCVEPELSVRELKIISTACKFIFNGQKKR